MRPRPHSYTHVLVRWIMRAKHGWHTTAPILGTAADAMVAGERVTVVGKLCGTGNGRSLLLFGHPDAEDPAHPPPGAGPETVDLPLIHRTPTFSVPPIGHRSTVFLDLLTTLDGGLLTKLDAPTTSRGR